MIAILSLVAKLVFLGLDIFVSDKQERERLKKQFLAWIVKAGKSSEDSSDLNKEYDDMIKDKEGWKKKPKSE